MPRPYRTRGKAARRTPKGKIIEKEKVLKRRTKTIAELEAGRLARLEAAKAAIETLVSQSEDVRQMQTQATRPRSVVEFCQANNIPLDAPYHPRYNVVGVDPNTDIQRLEYVCFGRAWPSEFGGLGAYGHLRNAIELTYPDIQWNPWLEMCMRSLTDEENVIKIGQTRLRFVNWVGCGSASKTFCAGLFASVWFQVDGAMGREPRSSVTLTSTSKGIIAQRVWPVIQKCFHEARVHPTGEKLKWGHMLDSQKMVLGLRKDGTKDAKHSICALAVEPGELAKSLDKIKGRHTERMMLIVDEANTTPLAIFDNVPNMLTSVRDFVVLVIGNAGSRLDAHGQCCEPARGWKSITIDETQWSTKGVAKWGIGPGICVHFDAAKSPNVLAGRTEHKHIYSFERWQQVLRMGDEYKNTLQHWSQDRGFWPPDGIQTTIFSEAMVLQHDGTGEFYWLTPPKPTASLDPAFGGDACWLQFGLLGEIHGGRRGLQLTEGQLVPFDPDSPDAVDYQIAKYVIAKCKENGVAPNLFGLDATGTGRGVAAFINQLWSTQIVQVEFGGAASDLPASTEDPRASHDVYANRVTELWYSTRDILLSDQLKGLYPEAIKEACSRVYFFVNRRYKVEPKEDMKTRLGYSPDHMDAIAVMCDVGRKNGLIATPYQVRGNGRSRENTSVLDAIHENAYSQPASISQYAEIIY